MAKVEVGGVDEHPALDVRRLRIAGDRQRLFQRPPVALLVALELGRRRFGELGLGLRPRALRRDRLAPRVHRLRHRLVGVAEFEVDVGQARQRQGGGAGVGVLPRAFDLLLAQPDRHVVVAARHGVARQDVGCPVGESPVADLGRQAIAFERQLLRRAGLAGVLGDLRPEPGALRRGRSSRRPAAPRRRGAMRSPVRRRSARARSRRARAASDCGNAGPAGRQPRATSSAASRITAAAGCAITCSSRSGPSGAGNGDSRRAPTPRRARAPGPAPIAPAGEARGRPPCPARRRHRKSSGVPAARPSNDHSRLSPRTCAAGLPTPVSKYRSSGTNPTGFPGAGATCGPTTAAVQGGATVRRLQRDPAGSQCPAVRNGRSGTGERRLSDDGSRARPPAGRRPRRGGLRRSCRRSARGRRRGARRSRCPA